MQATQIDSPNPVENPAENSIRPLRPHRADAHDTKPRNGRPPAAETSAHANKAVPERFPVPDHVRQRFVQMGRVWHFRDGAPAFRDHGRRLTTPSENTEVIAALLAIAQTRGWSRIRVEGSDRFRQEAWRQASLQGMSVRGYRPSALEQARLARDLASIQVKASGLSYEKVSRAPYPAPRPQKPVARASEPEVAEGVGEIFRGELLSFGRARYLNQSNAARSYFVTLKGGEGERTIWGRDLERALTESSSRPALGDEVGVKRIARELVTLGTPGPAPKNGESAPPRQVYRNRWVIDRWEAMAPREEAARVLRNQEADLAGAAKTNPLLVGPLLKLQHAEALAARHLRTPRERQVFVAAVREQFALRLARGQLVPEPELTAPPVPPSGHAARVEHPPRERAELAR
jgi:hypothetical protein